MMRITNLAVQRETELKTQKIARNLTVTIWMEKTKLIATIAAVNRVVAFKMSTISTRRFESLRE